MRILITADLHYDVSRSRKSAREIAEQITQTPADALVLVGDTAGADLEIMSQALELFADFKGRKLLVPGNHCLWCANGETSLQRYEQLIPELAGKHNFAVLDHEPIVIDGVAMVGSIGWYDYSLREESLGIPLEFYREKISPGAAKYYGTHTELLKRHTAVLTDRHFSLGARWMDGWKVDLGMTDETFVEMLIGKLKRQLEDVSSHAGRIVAFLHHLPCAELLPQNRPDKFAFAAAFMGAARFGELLSQYEKVTNVYCGHSHWPDRSKIAHMNIVNVGSTYVEKQLEIFDAPAANGGIT